MGRDRDSSALHEPEIDPYAPPKEAIGERGALEEPADLARAEAIRRKYIGHEASVKSIGHLHYLAVIFTLFVFVSVLAQLSSMPRAEAGEGTAWTAGVIFCFVVVILINLVMGVGLTGLKSWARWVEVALTILSLLYFLLGTAGAALLAGGPEILFFVVTSIISIYILYLLLSKKGSMVFSPEYREIMQVTPHVKYRTSRIVKGCLIAFVVLIVLSVVAALLAPRP
jgi:hypothetical protein